MNIAAVSSLLRKNGLSLFSVPEARLLLPRQNRGTFALQLHQWCRKDWIRRLKHGLYEVAYPEPAAFPDFYVANRLYEPSYVSLETALSHYQILPETAAQVTSVTPKATRRFKNEHGLFLYFTVQPSAFNGYGLLRVQGREVRIAEPEKAVLDRLYAGLRRGEDLESVAGRWDRAKLRKLDRKKLQSYARAFGASAQKLEESLHALLR